MSRLTLAKIGIPMLIAGLLFSAFYVPKEESESVETNIIACVRAICTEIEGGAGNTCESFPPRMSRLLLVRDGDSGTRSVVIRMSETACNN